MWNYYAQMQVNNQKKQEAEIARIESGNPVLISEESIPLEFRKGVPMDLAIRLSGLHKASDILAEMLAYKSEHQNQQQEIGMPPDPMAQIRAELKQAGVPDSAMPRMPGINPMPNIPDPLASMRQSGNEQAMAISSVLNHSHDGFANRVLEFLNAFVERGGNRQDFYFFDFRFELFQVFSSDGFVHFVGDDEARFFHERRGIKFQFFEQLLVIIPRLAVVRAGHVEQQHENFAALDVAQKFVAEADVRVRAFDESGHVANGEPVPVGVFHDADLRMQRGERIRGDFGSRFGYGGEQRGFAGVRIADEADFGHDAQFQQKITFVAGFARLREARCLACGGREIPIAQPATPAFAQNELLAVLRKIGDKFALFGVGFEQFSDVCSAQINFLRERATDMANQRPCAGAGFERQVWGFALVLSLGA